MKIRHLSDNLKSSTGNRGFTLIELLVVISIIGMLSSVVFASVQTARQKGVVGAGIKFDTYNYRAFGSEAFGIWRFNEPAGALVNAADESQYNKPGTRVGNASFVTGGVKGNAILLDGTGDYVNVTTALDNATKNIPNITVSAWINMDVTDPSPQGFIIAKDANIPTYGWGLYIDTVGSSIYWRIHNAAAGQVSCTTPTKGTWHHITATKKGAATAMYINGKLCNSGSGAPAVLGTNSSAANVYIGADSGSIAGNIWQFKGKIDEVAVYKDSLLAHEVFDLYARTAPAHGLALDK